MLKGINTTGRYVEVTGGTPSNYVNKSYNSGAHNQGQMMYDLEAQCMKVFDGQSWIVLAGGYATVGLTYQGQTILDWAQKKMLEEQAREALVIKYPELKEAHDALKNEQDKFDLLVTLAERFTNENNVQAAP